MLLPPVQVRDADAASRIAIVTGSAIMPDRIAVISMRTKMVSVIIMRIGYGLRAAEDMAAEEATVMEDVVADKIFRMKSDACPQSEYVEQEMRCPLRGRRIFG